MLPLQHLVTSIHSHWDRATVGTFPTMYPGMHVETSHFTAWCELWVETWSDPPRRESAPDQITASILVHCFNRNPVDHVGLEKLISDARGALIRKTIPIIDATAATPLEIGTMRIREHTMHNLTRNHAALGQEHLKHAVLIFEAHAQETPALL